MNQINHKELLLIHDNVSMCQETSQFLQTCANIVDDPQLKSMCQQMVQEHNQDMHQLARHITQNMMRQ